jgi:HD domain
MRNTVERWRPQGVSIRRATVAVAINLCCLLGAIAAFVLVAPAADWNDPAVLAALALIAVVAFAAELRFKSAIAAYFDASLALALIALAIAGPVAAFCVWVVPDLLSRFVLRQDPRLSPGMVATVSGFALAVLGGDAVLRLAEFDSPVTGAPALFTAGLVMAGIDFFVARGLFAPYYQGLRVLRVIRTEFLDVFPAVLAMLAFAVAVAALVPEIGVFALAPLALVILLPQLAFAALTRSRSISRLDPPEATALYADALADELRMSRFERRLLYAGADRIARLEGGGWAAAPGGEPPLTGLIVLGVDERWDGAGYPFAIPAQATPRASRVLAVARAWSSLTAAGTPGLPHREAMLDLAARAGTEFDPTVVDAAAEIVASEGAITRTADFEPKLHRLPLPATVRRRGLPALGAYLGART